jgi:hypothetical protein
MCFTPATRDTSPHSLLHLSIVMDLEAITIQIQTPPKDDEIDSPLEQDDSIGSLEMIDRPDEEESKEEEDEHAPDVEEETRDDEIVVEDVVHEDQRQNGNHDHESSLSSAPGSEADVETPKSDSTSLV